MEITGSASMSAMTQSMQKQTFGAQVVTKTLDYLNKSGSSYNAGNSMSQTYDFAKNVLGAYAGKGTIADFTV
ncbi:hypothetical protein MASR1M90_21420 [Desulfovibrionales bacterium]